MAGNTYTINFDTGIEKVEYAQSLYDFPSGELTSSGQTVGGATELYVRPIFKQGYELDSTNVVLTDTNGIYECRKNYVFITNVTFTSKQSTPTLTFKHFYDAGTIGSGTIKFRHYSQQEPSSGETWVLNSTLQNDTLQYGISSDWGVNTDEYSIYQSVKFTSNNVKYYGLCNYDDGRPPAITKQVLNVYSSTWSNTAYRTITFETAPTGDLLTWLQANGTKQGGGGSN